MNYIKDKRDRKIHQYISDFKGSNSDTKDNNGKEDQGTSNFYLNIESCLSYYSDPKAEVFWTKFVKE